MKKLRIAITAIGLAAVIGSSHSLRADDADKGGDHKAWGGREEMMKKELGLSDDQVAKMKELDKANAEAMKPLMEKAKLDVDSLRVLVDKKASDSDLKAAVEGLKADKKAMDEERQKEMDAKEAILNPLQVAKAAISMADRMMHGGMMGGPDGGRMGHGHGDGGKADDKAGKPDDGKKADAGY
jgi:Spy/CpxP family protein refolding chaperone